MKVTIDRTTVIEVEPAGLTSWGEPVLDTKGAQDFLGEWAKVDSGEVRSWMTPHDDSCPQPFILAWICLCGCYARVAMDEWPVLYDPDAGYRDESAWNLAEFPRPIKFDLEPSK